MTYCEDIGLKAGDKIRVLGKGRLFERGSVIEMVRDDDDRTPLFKNHNGYKSYFCLDSRIKGGEGVAWERVVDADQDGWIERSGGVCPVEKGTLIDVKLRDDEVVVGINASNHDRNHGYRLDWSHANDPRDIVAYRLHKPDCGQQEQQEQQESEQQPSLTDQLRTAIFKRDKQAAKAKRHAEKLQHREAEVKRLIGELEREIEDQTGLPCRIGNPHIEAILKSPALTCQALGRVCRIPPGVDVDDPNTWQVGDVIVCVDCGKRNIVTVGEEYIFIECRKSGFIVIDEDDFGCRMGVHGPTKFRFVRRPS